MLCMFVDPKGQELAQTGRGHGEELPGKGDFVLLVTDEGDRMPYRVERRIFGYKTGDETFVMVVVVPVKNPLTGE